jgi:hypothetical protein
MNYLFLKTNKLGYLNFLVNKIHRYVFNVLKDCKNLYLPKTYDNENNKNRSNPDLIKNDTNKIHSII